MESSVDSDSVTSSSSDVDAVDSDSDPRGSASDDSASAASVSEVDKSGTDPMVAGPPLIWTRSDVCKLKDCRVLA